MTDIADGGQRAWQGAWQDAWQDAWKRLGLSAPPGLRAQLEHAYAEPARHYHTLQHLAECLALFDEFRTLAQAPGEVELALWFHDAIYDVKGRDNEARSADWAVASLAAAGAAPAVQARVRDLILATRHDAVPDAPDAQLLVDIDLAILGAPPARFAEYDAQVRAEYRWVPGPVYRVKRRAVLRSFLARDPLYLTAALRARCEAQARANLAAAVA